MCVDAPSPPHSRFLNSPPGQHKEGKEIPTQRFGKDSGATVGTLLYSAVPKLGIPRKPGQGGMDGKVVIITY